MTFIPPRIRRRRGAVGSDTLTHSDISDTIVICTDRQGILHALRRLRRPGRLWPRRLRPRWGPGGFGGPGGRLAAPDAARQRPRGDPAPARGGAPQRLPGDAGDRAAQRRRLAPEPRLGLPGLPAARRRGARSAARHATAATSSSSPTRAAATSRSTASSSARPGSGRRGRARGACASCSTSPCRSAIATPAGRRTPATRRSGPRRPRCSPTRAARSTASSPRTSPLQLTGSRRAPPRAAPVGHTERPVHAATARARCDRLRRAVALSACAKRRGSWRRRLPPALRRATTACSSTALVARASASRWSRSRSAGRSTRSTARLRPRPDRARRVRAAARARPSRRAARRPLLARGSWSPPRVAARRRRRAALARRHPRRARPASGRSSRSRA